MGSNAFLLGSVLIISLISTGITYILFKKLSSFAEGQSKVFGGTVKYGGAVGGFVIVFSLLTYSMTTLRISMTEAETSVTINGHWFIKVTQSETLDVRYGRAEIVQAEGGKDFQIQGELRSTRTPPSATFFSHSATIEDDRKKIIFIFENSMDELGVCIGTAMTDEPDNFFIQYYDIDQFDTNLDVFGRVDFSRKPYKEQESEKNKGESDDWYLGKEIEEEEPVAQQKDTIFPSKP